MLPPYAPPHAYFLLFQTIPPTVVFLLFKTLSPYPPSLFSFLPLLLSHLLFSASVALVSAVNHYPLTLLRYRNWSGSSVPVAARFFAFFGAAATSGYVAVAYLVGELGGPSDIERRNIGVEGYLMGYVYAGYYLYKMKWVLEFPILQRGLFSRLNTRMLMAFTSSLRLTLISYLVSCFLGVFFPHDLRNKVSLLRPISEQFTFYVGNFLVVLGWELSHHSYQVLNTKRCIFAPPKGSAAAATNPSKHLLAALEESAPNSLPQYLAYLDLCMICKNNVDSWRRAALFGERCETYKRVVSLCLRPLEQLASKLGEGLEGSVYGKSPTSNHLQFSTEHRLDPKYSDLFNNNFQLYEWCVWSAASLTARSKTDDEFGVAQRSGSNAAVMSTLISSLLAVETYMGKKTNIPTQFTTVASIKWAKFAPVVKKRVGRIHPKAYALADVLRNSIYLIISACHDQMVSSAKSGDLEKYWVMNEDPPFGSRELLLHKLKLFVDFQAN